MKYIDPPIKEDKGDYNGSCNRTVCQKPGAVYYNHSTRKHYCKACANLINKENYSDSMRIFGHDLCTLVEPEIKLTDDVK